jgi:hypothetical protein
VKYGWILYREKLAVVCFALTVDHGGQNEVASGRLKDLKDSTMTYGL